MRLEASRLTVDAKGFPYIGQRPLAISPRERAVLAALVMRQPEIVSKDEFAHTAWRGADMSDENLARCISRLRTQLQPSGHQIDSVYGIGYRLRLAKGALESEAPKNEPSDTEIPQHAETYMFCRMLLQQATPSAVSVAIARLRQLIASAPIFWAGRVGLADGLAVAVGWGLLPTEPSIAEGLSTLSAIPVDAQVGGRFAAQAALLDLAWQFDKAGEAFQKALAEDSQHADTLLAYARHLLYVDRPDLAVEQLLAAKRIAPHRSRIRMTLARALLQAGQSQPAVHEAQTTSAEHPGDLAATAFSLAMQAMVSPRSSLVGPAWRLTQGVEAPPFAWAILASVLARTGHRSDAIDVIEAALMCSSTTVGEATLYASPLAALGEMDRAADLLQAAFKQRCGMLAMVLRDPAHTHWLRHHPIGRKLLHGVFAKGSEGPSTDDSQYCWPAAPL